MIRSIYFLGIIFCLSACAQGDNDAVVPEASKETTDGIEKTESSVQDPVPYVENYPSGSVKMKGQKVDNLKVGIWTSYYENGVKWSEGEYINGERNGKFKDYFENGMLRYKGAYVNNLKQGPWLFYDQEGKILKKVNYHRGELSEE